MKNTLVIGASINPERYSYKAVHLLQEKGISVRAFGIREGSIGDVDIVQDFPIDEYFHTISLYLRPELQEEYIPKIIALMPSRIIFNPGTENPEFKKLAQVKTIPCENACTLVLLRTNQF